MFYLQQYILVIAIFTSVVVPAQIPSLGSPAVTNFSRSDYQAGTQNWSVGQDSRGIMYFGNNKGLLEYDGTNWHVFELPNRTILRSFVFPDKGVIYVGGQNEIGAMHMGPTGKYDYKTLTEKVPEKWQGFEDVWKIFDQDDKLYFCSEKAVFLFQGEEMQVIEPPGGRFENFFLLDGNIYLQDQKQGLFRHGGKDLQIVPGSEALKKERIVAMLPYHDDRTLVITFSAGIYMMDADGVQPWNTSITEFLITNQAYCAIQLADGNYAIGTSQNGVIIMDTNGDLVMHLNREKGLQNNTILCVYQDLQQNLRMGLDNGIDFAEINSPFTIIRPETGIKGTGYASIIHDGKLYLGTNQGLYCTEWNAQKSLSDLPVFQLVKNAKGQVWNINQLDRGIVVSQHKGASYLRPDRLETFSDIQGAWKFMELPQNPGYAIEGTYTGLVLYRNKHAGNRGVEPDWEMVKRLEGFGESSRVFEQDADGHIWVSHAYKGLFRLRLSLGTSMSSANAETIEEIDFFGKDQGLPDALFINVTKIRDELVFTTPAGIYKFDKATGTFGVHPDLTAIFGENRNVHRLIEDKQGHIWFSIDAEFGVLRVDDTGVVNKLELAYFNQIQEELVDGFEHVYAHDANNVFIGTEKGFIHFNPSRQAGITFPFGMLIRQVTSITVGDSVLFWGNGGDVADAEKPAYPYDLNDFRFAFTVPYFEKSRHLQYRHKLDGFDSDWSEWSSKTEKEYTNLAHGDYTFTAQARNAYGQVSDGLDFGFTISPPWYATGYARFGYFLLGLLVIFGIVQYITKKEERKTEAFKREQVEKLKRREAEFRTEVEKSETEIVGLRNEKLSTDINHKNSQLASATMHLVQKSEILIKLKTDLTTLTSEAPHEFKRKIDRITRAIESDIQLDNNWDQFEIYFDQVHENFFKRLRQNFPELTPKDQKLCAYLRMNLSTKEIAPLLNISVRGVEISRYRVRKKLGIDSEKNLVEFIMDV